MQDGAGPLQSEEQEQTPWKERTRIWRLLSTSSPSEEIHQPGIIIENIGRTSQSGNKMPLKKAAGL